MNLHNLSIRGCSLMQLDEHWAPSLKGSAATGAAMLSLYAQVPWMGHTHGSRTCPRCPSCTRPARRPEMTKRSKKHQTASERPETEVENCFCLSCSSFSNILHVIFMHVPLFQGFLSFKSQPKRAPRSQVDLHLPPPAPARPRRGIALGWAG